jgi:hypothetical protein
LTEAEEPEEAQLPGRDKANCEATKAAAETNFIIRPIRMTSELKSLALPIN